MFWRLKNDPCKMGTHNFTQVYGDGTEGLIVTICTRCAAFVAVKIEDLKLAAEMDSADKARKRSENQMSAVAGK